METEDKAKRYDEAIKRAKGVIEQNPLMEYLKKGIEYILPELKESEDERIRKCVKYAIDKLFLKEKIVCDVHKDDVLAWLEKQRDKDKLIKELGEYKVKYTQEVLERHLNSMSNKDDERLRKTTIAFLKDYANTGYENAVECIDWLEKQGEQKQDPCEHCADKRLNCHNFPCVKKKAFEQGKSVFDVINEEKVDNANKVEPRQDEFTKFEKAVKQVREEAIECGDNHNSKADAEMFLSLAHKSAWSEEDKVILDEIIDFFENGTVKLQHDLSLYASWLKSLKDRVLPQPKQKWSEEDEQITLSIEQVMNCASLLNIVPEKIDKIKTWLKSLKDRYTWKPTEKQINAIRLARSFVTDDFGNNPTLSEVLKELEEQLKKLK